MTPLIEGQKEQIAELCKSFKVRRLDLFGSAATGGFDAQTSDLDFLVSFSSSEPAEYSRCYFGLVEALERLFKCRVDLVTERSVRNPYFRQTLEQTRLNLYGT